jgi:hypothetical protein
MSGCTGAGADFNLAVCDLKKWGRNSNISEIVPRHAKPKTATRVPMKCEKRLRLRVGHLSIVVPRARIELATHGFSVHCSTD